MSMFSSVPPMSLERQIAALENQRYSNWNEIQRLNNEIQNKFRNLNLPNKTLNEYVESNEPIKQLIKQNGELSHEISLLKNQIQKNKYQELLNEQDEKDKKDDKELMKEFAKLEKEAAEKDEYDKLVSKVDKLLSEDEEIVTDVKINEQNKCVPGSCTTSGGKKKSKSKKKSKRKSKSKSKRKSKSKKKSKSKRR